MKKISAIVLVYNEERLIELCLKQFEPYVDEIIVIDGSSKGPSTDNTAEIVKGFDKVKYLSGTYKTRSEAWDIAAQKNHGINEATGDIILFVSADMLFYDFEYFNDIIRKEEDGKVFFCPTIEFWNDTKHIRLYEQVKNLSIPGGVNEAVAISKDLQPIAGEHGALEIVTTNPKSRYWWSILSSFILAGYVLSGRK